MKQTPAHSVVNKDLLNLIPGNSRRVIEVGCMHGQMAKAYRINNSAVDYVGIDIDPDYASVASEFCTEAFAADIESISQEKFNQLFPSDCWIFGDCLEHLRDPWLLLRRIRANIDRDGCLLACIPNAQHWSVQWRLLSGQFRYEDSGLLDRTHLRWLTRTTMLEMFESTGWKVAHGFSRLLPSSPLEEPVLTGIQNFALACGLDAELAVRDAKPFQYVFKVTPA
jgi:SAM-dependent methyltransferase